MKILLAIFIVAGVAFGGWQIYSTWVGVSKDEKVPAATSASSAPVPVVPAQLPGLTPSLEPSLEAAHLKGANGLRDWLTTYGKTVKDPRLASIQLDYVVLVARTNPGEARRIFADVKKRTPPASPVYPRIKLLEKTYD